MTVLTKSLAQELVDNQGSDVVIPNSVTSIGEGAFENSYLTSVVIPDSVSSIGDYAFYDNELDSIAIGNSVTWIGEGAFDNNYLTSVVVPDSIISIGDYAFYDNELDSIAIGNSVTLIGKGAFDSNYLTSIIIPDSVISIGDNAFHDNELDSIDIGNSVIWIGKGAFDSNSLTSIIIPDSVISIGDNAFHDNELDSIDIGNSVAFIGDNAFHDNFLDSIDIGNSVAFIGEGAFAYNYLTSVIIPNSVTSIGDKAFNNNPLSESVSISEDAIFDLSVFPKGVEIIRRGDPSVFDSDGDGFVDGVSNYQMWTSTGGIDLTNNKGRKFSNDTSKKWDAIKAIQAYAGFSVLLRKDHNEQSKFKIVSANKKGEWKDVNPWKTALQMFESGNEDIFDTDFNGNDQIGFMEPTAISLSPFSFNENISSGSVVSKLSGTDLDPDDTHTYSLVSGSGDTDNTAFSIKGDKLKINASPDHETQSSYSIRLKTTDSSGGLSYEAPFTLTVNDPDEEINEDIIEKPTKFNKKSSDKIINFNPSIDTLQIDPNSFGIGILATFAVGKNKNKVINKLAQKDFDFLYDQKKGDLYFNENGADKGFGDGGIIAIIKGAPDLTIQNIDFL